MPSPRPPKLAAGNGAPRGDVLEESRRGLASAALREGAGALEAFQLELFSPVSPMLAQTAADVAASLAGNTAGAAAFEWKMDGARIQVHKRGPEVPNLYAQLK